LQPPPAVRSKPMAKVSGGPGLKQPARAQRLQNGVHDSTDTGQTVSTSSTTLGKRTADSTTDAALLPIERGKRVRTRSGSSDQLPMAVCPSSAPRAALAGTPLALRPPPPRDPATTPAAPVPTVGGHTRGQLVVVKPTAQYRAGIDFDFADICRLGLLIEEGKMRKVELDIRNPDGSLVHMVPRGTMNKWLRDDHEVRQLQSKKGYPGVSHWRAEKEYRRRTHLTSGGDPLLGAAEKKLMVQIATMARKNTPYDSCSCVSWPCALVFCTHTPSYMWMRRRFSFHCVCVFVLSIEVNEDGYRPSCVCSHLSTVYFCVFSSGTSLTCHVTRDTESCSD
jgi:hypothetical protein